MALTNIKYLFLSKIIKIFLPNRIVNKKILGTNKLLFYERHQFLSYFLQKEIKHELNVQQKIKKYIKENDLVFDIGANIGQYSLLFSELVIENGKIISFEPDSKSFSFLQFNTNINKCKNVICCNYGVGSTSTTSKYYRDIETGGRRGSFKEGFVKNEVVEEIEIRNLDSIIAEYGIPNFIKLDVEGFEEEIICSSVTNLNNTIFLVEVRKETKNNIYNYFTSKNFKCTRVDCIKDAVIDNIDDLPDYCDLIFQKN